MTFSASAASGGINEEVWIDGESFYKSINHEKESTIYFEGWSSFVDQFLQDKDYYVAMQLHESFDPFPEDEIALPSLRTLSAIADESLKGDYFQFLERFARTKGINHFVLPDTSGLSILEKNVVRQANAHSPFYFLYRTSLSRTIPDSKKAYNNVSSQPQIWIIDQDEDTRKIEKWSERRNKKKDEFYRQLKKAKAEKFIPAFDLPESLSQSIFSSGVIALDPKGIFPIRDKEITYLGSDLILRKRLSQYARVFDYRIENITCIVDARSYRGNLLEGDIVIQNGLDIKGQTSLSLPNIQINHVDIKIAKMLFGASSIIGLSDNPDVRQIVNNKFLSYTNPSVEGFDIDQLSMIDSLAEEAIAKMATPGIQIAILKKGQVVAEKSYGYYTYDSLKKVSNSTVYDVASVTKVVATLPAIGYLLDNDMIDLDDSISQYLPEFAGSNKSGVTIKQLLAHQAGLRSYVPFWRMMMTGDRLDAFYYKTPEDEKNDIRSYGIDPDPIMLDSLKSYIVKSKLIKNKDTYHYSDLGFMILHLLVEKLTNQPFDEFLSTNFYRPMGLEKTYFNPTKNGISPREIAPTEYDTRYRNYQVWGEVHDRNALVFGGISGHAGLFSTSKDLAIMMSMFLNDGFYGGKRYLSENTVRMFNNRFFSENRRGLGWDKNNLEETESEYFPSDKSFGHTGFTGTMLWADPENDLIYIFLSNRIYPNADNWKLGELETRSKIHKTIYQALESPSNRNLFLDN